MAATFLIPVARTEKGKPVLPRNAEKGVPYFCVNCSKQVILRAGQIIRRHFAHKANPQCQRESLLHKTAKFLLAATINDYLEGREETKEDQLGDPFELAKIRWRMAEMGGKFAYYDWLSRAEVIKDPLIRIYCRVGHPISFSLPKNFSEAKVEVRTQKGRILDVGIFRGSALAFGIEVLASHRVDNAKAKDLTIDWVEVKADITLVNPYILDALGFRISDELAPCRHCDEAERERQRIAAEKAERERLEKLERERKCQEEEVARKRREINQTMEVSAYIGALTLTRVTHPYELPLLEPEEIHYHEHDSEGLHAKSVEFYGGHDRHPFQLLPLYGFSERLRSLQDCLEEYMRGWHEAITSDVILNRRGTIVFRDLHVWLFENLWSDWRRTPIGQAVLIWLGLRFLENRVVEARKFIEPDHPGPFLFRETIDWLRGVTYSPPKYPRDLRRDVVDRFVSRYGFQNPVTPYEEPPRTTWHTSTLMHPSTLMDAEKLEISLEMMPAVLDLLDAKPGLLKLPGGGMVDGLEFMEAIREDLRRRQKLEEYQKRSLLWKLSELLKALRLDVKGSSFDERKTNQELVEEAITWLEKGSLKALASTSTCANQEADE